MRKNKLRIITFLIGSLGGGGAERVTVSLADYFVKRGYNVRFIAFSKQNNNYKIPSHIEIAYLPENHGNIKSYINRIASLKKYLSEQNPEYVISLGLGHQYLFLGQLMNKYRFILSERNAPQLYYNRFGLFVTKYCFKRAYKVVFQTDEAMNFYGNIVRGKAVVISNPITKDLPEPYEGIRKKTIVSVNRLSAQKNLFMLLRAFKCFLEKYPDYILELYGKGEQREQLIKYAEELNIISNIKFMGQISNVHNAILDASMFVSSSDYEGMSNAMLEAMALGLPVVCTDCPIGGARKIIKNHKNGLLVPVGNDMKFSEAMINIISNPNLSAQMGMEASKLRDELSIERIALQWEKLMQ